jgi:hypothetical protein
VVAVGGVLGQQLGVLGVTFDQAIARVGVEAALDRPVLAVVVDPDDLVPGAEQVGDEISANKPGSPGYQYLQSLIGPVTPQMSTTSLPLSSNVR